MTDASQLVENVTELMSFPDIAMKINQSLDDENSTANSLGNLIEQDPALTANILKLANSPVYSGGAEIDSVAKAVTRVGSREIQQLTFGICATRAFAGISNELISVEDFWRHSLCCAIAARMVGARLRIPNPGMLFTAGLLHDVGHLVMFSLKPELSTQALALSRDEMDGEFLYLAERRVFGYDHTQVGRELGRQWHWPESLIECIERHHQPFEYDSSSPHAAVVHLANSLATMAELESESLDDAADLDPQTWDRLGLAKEDAIAMVEELNGCAQSLLKMFVA